MTLHCTAPGCAVPRQHASDCRDDTCRGCQPALAVDGQAFCDTDTARLRRWLEEIPGLFAEVVDPDTVVDERQAHTGITPAALDKGAPLGRPRDPVANRLPAGAVPGERRGPRVSGGGEDALPVRYVEAGPGATGPIHAWLEDQVGDLPPAALLDMWARDWQRHRGLDEYLPAPAVDLLCGWLADRLDPALSDHPAMPEFYTEIRALHRRLWTEAGHTEPPPEHCRGIPCKGCDRQSLYRRADGTGDVECHTQDCRRVYRRAEYDQWTGLLAASTKRMIKSMQDLHTWLTRELATAERDAAVALAADAWPGPVAAALTAVGDPAVSAHVIRWDPAHALGVIRLRQHLLAEYATTCRDDDPETRARKQDLLRLLAEPDADRPGYRKDEWRP